MSKLYVTEYAEIATLPGNNKNPQIPVEPPIAEQVVDYSGGVAASNAFNFGTRFVRISTDAVCSVSFGTAPTATTSMQRMAADTVEYKAIPQGAVYKVSAITNT